MNKLPNLPMNNLTIHKYREPNYLPAYKEGTTFTTVESPLQITPFYSKQTQFPKGQK
jgi:hypothetical protein